MNTPTDRQLFRETVAAIADKARAKLPECTSRIDAAVKLVLLDEVTLLPDGPGAVGSCTDPTKTYTVNGTCSCKDFPQAPHQFCKHRLSVAIAKRVQELLPPPVAAAAAVAVAPAALPEAACSVNCHIMVAGRQVQITLRGTAEADVLVRLEEVLQRYPASAPQAPAPPIAATPQCPTHGALKKSAKGKGWYCPVKLDDGSWCPSKGT